MDGTHISSRERMVVGRYIATADIPLKPPFRASVLPQGAKFDILETTDGLSLVRYEGIRVWKANFTLVGRALCVLKKAEPSAAASPQVTQQQATLHPVFQDILGAMKAANPALL